MPNAPEQEPSIEEILASIRQIISDDEEQPAEAAPPPRPAPKAAPPPPPPPPPPKPKDDVLDLTDVVHDDPVPPPPVQEKPRVQIDMRDVEEEPEDDHDDEALLTDHAASATFEGFARLASHMAIDRKGTGATTLEDIVRDLMRPMLREWLDVNLPPLIEKMVQKELDELARQALED